MLNKKSRFYKYIILVLALLIIPGFLLTFSVNVKAASAQTYFPFVRNCNNTIPADYISYVDQTYGESYYYFIGEYRTSGNSYNNGPWCSLLLYPKTNGEFLAANHDDYYFNLVANVTAPSGVQVGFLYKRPNGNFYYSTLQGGINYTWFQNRVSSLYDSNKDYYVNFDLKTQNDAGVILLAPPFVIPTHGHAQDPMNNIPSFVPPLGMHPTQAPSAPSYTFPTLATRPTWDTNHPFDSLFDLIEWGFDFSYDLLTGILQNIIDWATFFGNLIVWIYEQIWDYFTFFIDWLYRIFEYLFSPIYNFLNALFHDGDEVMSISDLLYEFMTRFDSFSSSIFQDTWFTSFWNNFSTELLNGLQYFSKVALFFGSLVALGTVNGEFAVGTLINNLFLPNPADVVLLLYQNDDFDILSTSITVITTVPGLFNNLISTTPSPTFHIPSLIYHGQQIGDFDIDFSWYAPYKIYVDLVLNAFLIVGYIYWLFITFGSHLRGHFMEYAPNVPENNQRLFRG